jgi:NaMN:DMB phosphoribosyltransferase
MNQETNQQEESNEVKFNISCDAENRISIQVEGITQTIMAVLLNAAMKSEDVKRIILTTATIIKDHSDELTKIENLN